MSDGGSGGLVWVDLTVARATVFPNLFAQLGVSVGHWGPCGEIWNM